MQHRVPVRKKPIAAVVAGAFAFGLMLVQPADAQLSGAIVRGQITMADTAVKPGLAVVAVNKADGRVYRTVTVAGGHYVLVGLEPGEYEIRVTDERGQMATQVVTVLVGETARLDLALPAPGVLGRVTIVGALARKDVRTPSVATSVTREEIAALPQVDRNFLSFADLAPGVSFTQDPATGHVRVQSGAQNQDNINLFIDGVGQKNYILRGGISGLDSSRGNPFPQSAIAEYQVITQNYKAEFDQVSSAAINTVTRSGGNTFAGDVFVDHTESDWTAKDPFQQEAERQGIKRPNAKQNQYGFSLGGPIRVDQAHYFFAYERKDIATPRQVVLQNDALLPNAGIVPSLRALQGSTTDEFQQDLLFGRADLQLSGDQRLTFTTRIRREDDHIAENKRLSAPGNDKSRVNDETRADLKHEWAAANWLNEARVGYEEFVWSPRSRATTPFLKYNVSPANNCPTDCRAVIFTGGSPDAQFRKQSGIYVQNDLTYIGWAGHTVKGGIKVKDLTFDLSGTARSVDTIELQIHNATGIATAFNVLPAIAPTGVKIGNTQIGLYIQDDWQVSRQLELNYGIRWDYETNALNKDYVTPADRVAGLFAVDITRWGITPPAGQTYDQSLARGGINIRDFISTGNSRDTYKGAFQPRIGFSYDLRGDRNTVIFGAYGRAYDRAMANHALDEKQKNAQPNGEIWLIRNEHEMPFTDQFSLGLRQAIGQWNAEAGLLYSHARNQFVWFGGNRDALGGFATQSVIDPLWGGPPNPGTADPNDTFGTLILGDFVAQAKTKSVYLRADKPYTRAAGWGLSATYTFSDAETTNREWTNDIFSWTYGRGPVQWYPSRDVAPHKVVVAGLTDRLLPYGIMLSGRMTLADGRPYRIIDCSRGWSLCVFQEGTTNSFRQFDLAVSKDVRAGPGSVTLRADVINLFNWVNYGAYNDWGGGPGNPRNYLGGDNPDLGKPTAMGGPMRTFKVTLGYRW
jgi:hypothetical protein